MVSNVKNTSCLSYLYRNKPVKVILEFPDQSDKKAEEDFISGLKRMYLKKAESGAWQRGEDVLA